MRQCFSSSPGNRITTKKQFQAMKHSMGIYYKDDFAYEYFINKKGVLCPHLANKRNPSEDRQNLKCTI